MGNCQTLPSTVHGLDATPTLKESTRTRNTHKKNNNDATKARINAPVTPTDACNDPFRVGSALVSAKPVHILRNENLHQASEHSDSSLRHLSLSNATTASHTTISCSGSNDGGVVDYKALYEQSLQQIHDLQETTANLERQHVEIRTAKELYLNIFERFPALIWRSRLDKQCDYFNQTWLEWTGKTLEQEFGFGWAEGVHKEDFDRCLEIYVEAFDKQEPFYTEYRLKHKSGEYRWIGDHGTPFRDLDGSFLGYIGSCYDISEQLEAKEKLKRLNSTKDQFFRILAHDLRNPIATFVSMSELLKEGYQDFTTEEMTEIAEHMHKDSKNTMALLDHVLEWSRSQSDQISFNPMPVQVGDLFEDAVSHVDLCAKAKGIGIRTEVLRGDGDVALTLITVDKNMLVAVLRNLLMNAIKFSHPGASITLQAQWGNNYPPSDKLLDSSSSSTAEPNPAILLTVADNGVGMEQEQRDSLFELQASSGRVQREGTSNEKGSGLGLVICGEFIETRHKGRIWAESPKEGSGTNIRIRIPQPQA